MFVSATLDLRLPPPHPFPDVGDWHWTQHQPFKAVYASPHRSVFLMRQRIQRHPFLLLFDAPDANVSTDVRTSATIPQQALFLMNNSFIVEESEAFARRVLAHEGDDRERIRYAVQWAWARPVREAEIDSALAYLDRFSAEAARAGSSDDESRIEAWRSYARVLLTANEFFYLD